MSYCRSPHDSHMPKRMLSSFPIRDTLFCPMPYCATDTAATHQKGHALPSQKDTPLCPFSTTFGNLAEERNLLPHRQSALSRNKTIGDYCLCLIMLLPLTSWLQCLLENDSAMVAVDEPLTLSEKKAPHPTQYPFDVRTLTRKSQATTLTHADSSRNKRVQPVRNQHDAGNKTNAENNRICHALSEAKADTHAFSRWPE